VDGRTLQLIDALHEPGGAFLFELLVRGPLTEAELLQAVPDTSQSSANRKLRELGGLGVLARAPGPRQYKNRPWTVAVENAADAFLGAAIELSKAIVRVEEEERSEAEAELREARRKRTMLGAAEGGGAEE
jgi:hypothetical protein